MKTQNTVSISDKESALLKFRRHSRVRKIGKSLEKAGKRLLRGIVYSFFRAEAIDPGCMHGIRRILFVRPNFRIGNMLISSPLLFSLQARYPYAEIDYLGADTTAELLKNYPVHVTYLMSRRFILRPWEFFRMIRIIRKNKYDMVIEPSAGSFTAMMCMRLSGARYRVGGGKWADGICNVPVDIEKGCHTYDTGQFFSKTLGLMTRDRPLYIVGETEKARALQRLSALNLREGNSTRPFAALFIGGHQEKRWDVNNWIALAKMLSRQGIGVAIFLGPEEVRVSERIERELGTDCAVIHPLPLPDFAALIQHARLFVTPDSGPMHLAVALDVPTLAIIQKNTSLPYAPRGHLDQVCMFPTPEDLNQAIQQQLIRIDMADKRRDMDLSEEHQETVHSQYAS